MLRLHTFILFLIGFVSLPFVHADGRPLAFNDGETFEFRVSWGLFRGAGHLSVKAARDDQNGQARLRITTQTRTGGVIRAFYPFDGESKCLFDAKDGRLLEAAATTQSPSKNTDAVAILDYDQKLVRYQDRVDAKRSEDLPLPEGQPMDMITTLLASRAWHLEPGESRDVVVMFDKEFYELKIVAERIEKIDTERGEVETIVLTPKMEKNPRGMFKRGGEVHVWVTRDAQRLPVRLKVSLKFGTGTAYLTQHQPGREEAPAPAVAAVAH